MFLLSKINTKMSFGLTQTVDFVAWPPKTQPKSPMTGEGHHEAPLVQENLASQLKIKHKKGLLASQGQWILWPGRPKHSQKHPGRAEGQPEGPLVQGNLASQFKRL
jgi:hypothetical protein